MKFALVRLTAALMVAPIFLSGCATASYNIQERFGIEKRDILVDYDDLSRAYKRADGEADTVRSRVKSVKRVSRDLFREWEGELNEYSDPALRRASERQLRETQERYDVLVSKMDNASASMDPVLSVFKDRVLYLKHNLNARAIASLFCAFLSGFFNISI